MTIALAALLLATATGQEAGAQPAGAELRAVTLWAADDKGTPAAGLSVDEVALLENGVAREIESVRPDERPLDVAVLVDSSAEVGSAYRLFLVDGVNGFLARLPAGARYTLWTTGDRPQKILDLTDDRGAALKALRRVIPQGGSYMFDALAEASRELKKQEGARTAVVVVSGRSTNFSSRDRYRAVDDARKNSELFFAVQFDEGSAGFETRADYDYVFSQLAKDPGGVDEHPLTAMAVGAALQRFAGQLAGQYRLRYATLPEIKERKVEVQVARPGVKVRVGPVGPPES